MKRAIVVLLLVVAIPVVGTLIWEFTYDSYVQSAQSAAQTVEFAELACSQVVELLPTPPLLKTREFLGTVHDPRTAVDHRGCRLDVAGRDIALVDGHWPHEFIRERLPADHWREDISRAADGAGSTAFAMRTDTATCFFSAAWSLSNGSDPEPVADEYRLEVGCVGMVIASYSE